VSIIRIPVLTETMTDEDVEDEFTVVERLHAYYR
jgi:hypothetical protein